MSFSQQLFAVIPGSKKAREAEQSVHYVYRYQNDLYTGGAFVKVGVCLYRESGPGRSLRDGAGDACAKERARSAIKDGPGIDGAKTRRKHTAALDVGASAKLQPG